MADSAGDEPGDEGGTAGGAARDGAWNDVGDEPGIGIGESRIGGTLVGGNETGDVVLAVMCKAPSLGFSKTRLSPPLSADEAVELSRCFLTDVGALVGQVADNAAARAAAVFTPAEDQDLLNGLLPADFAMLAQRGDDLGQRCAAAVEDLLGLGFEAVCLLGADSPTLPAAYLHQAVALLRQPGERVVLGPALDGGYYLIGVKRAHHGLFSDISWSTRRVLTQTVAQAEALGLPIDWLPPWYDVDDALSLTWLVEELLGHGKPPVEGPLVAGAPVPGRPEPGDPGSAIAGLSEAAWPDAPIPALRLPSAARTRTFLGKLLARGEGPPPEPVGRRPDLGK